MRHKIALGLAILAASFGITVFNAPSAAADTVTVSYICGVPTFPPHWNDAYRVTVTAPATATRGQTVTVTASLVGIQATANTYQAALVITLGGASSGTITATGLTNPAIPAGGTPKWNGGRAQVTLASAGTVTFTPGGFTVTRNGSFQWRCTAQGSPAVADSTRVS
jgi:hypothetical protein